MPVSSLGVPREHLPQIQQSDIPEFITFANSEGISVKKESVPCDTLKPTQLEYNEGKIIEMDLDFAKNGKPIIVSADDYIIDGHHRWVKLFLDCQTNLITVWRFDCNVLDLIACAKRFPKTFYKEV